MLPVANEAGGSCRKQGGLSPLPPLRGHVSDGIVSPLASAVSFHNKM